jgi:ubiquitin-conjugating enzyme E2 G2
MTEYKQLTTNGAPDNMFTAGPISEDDFFTWEAVIDGPKDTPFEGGVFVAKLEFVSRSINIVVTVPSERRFLTKRLPSNKPSDYPLSPFKMKFEPPIFHPNSEPIILIVICFSGIFGMEK